MNNPPTFVRSLTAEERQGLETGRKSADPFTVRRSQILLAGAGGMVPAEVGRVAGCPAQAVRDAIRAFEADGVAWLTAQSHARRDGRPVSATTEDFLACVSDTLATEGKCVFVLVRDNAV